jgi:hypothetical protein
MVTCIVIGDLEKTRSCKLLSQNLLEELWEVKKNLRMDVGFKVVNPGVLST